MVVYVHLNVSYQSCFVIKKIVDRLVVYVMCNMACFKKLNVMCFLQYKILWFGLR